MNYLPILFLLSAIVSGCGGESKIDGDNRDLGALMINALPLPSENEFESPEAAARSFAEGLIEDDWRKVLSATSLRLRCERVDFESTVKNLGGYTAARVGDPSAPMASFAANVGQINRYLAIQLLLMGEKELDISSFISVETGADEIAAARKRALYQRPPGLKIAMLEIDREVTKGMIENRLGKDPTHKVLNVSDLAYVIIEFEGVPTLGNAQVDCVMAKIDTNWLVDTTITRR